MASKGNVTLLMTPITTASRTNDQALNCFRKRKSTKFRKLTGP